MLENFPVASVFFALPCLEKKVLIVSSHYQGSSSERLDPNAGANASGNPAPNANVNPQADSNAGTNANSGNPQPNSEHWEPWEPDELVSEETQPHPAVPRSAGAINRAPTAGTPSPASQSSSPQNYAQFMHREHVTNPLPAYPFQPVYPPSAQAPAYPQPQQGQGQQQAAQPPAQQQPGTPAPYQPGAQSHPNYPAHPAYPPYPGSPGGYQAAQPSYPGYAPYPQYPAYPGYSQAPYQQPYGYGYPPGPYAPYGWQPQPKRDGYQLAMSIVGLIGSGLAILGGAVCAFFAVLLALVPTTASQLPASQLFSGMLTLLAFACAGLIGGSFSLYHSIRGLMQKTSTRFTLPPFWIFVILYAVAIAIGFVLKANKMAVTHAPLTAFLIALTAIFPALALLAIGVRRLRNQGNWPTTWRRFTLALTSGATLGIGLALLLELGVILLLARGAMATNLTQCIDKPDLPVCQQNPAVFGLIIIVAALVAPLVEETVKPLGVALFMGRVRSASEAFILGMAAGIGFNLIETVGYIGTGYHDWVDVALQRTATGLLHGFGAAMVALGWYQLTHAKDRRFLQAFGCWLYAVLQHAIWNGSVTLVLLPAPIGPLLNSWNLNLGFTTLPFPEIINIVEAILFFLFFLYMTGRLRRTTPPPESSPTEQPSQTHEPQPAGRFS